MIENPESPLTSAQAVALNTFLWSYDERLQFEEILRDPKPYDQFEWMDSQELSGWIRKLASGVQQLLDSK